MAINAATLEIKVLSDVGPALAGLNRVNKAVTGTASFLGGAAQSALGFVGGMVGLNAVSSVVGGVSDAVFGLNSTLEGSSLALETMLGSSKAAGDQLNRLKQFATATPFELPQLLEAQQRLLAFGFGVGDVIPLLTNLGDAAAGLNLGGGGLSRLVTAIGQIQAKGKVQGDELLQLTEAGVPGLQLLAKHLGKTADETQKLVSAGKIPAGVFLEAFQAFAQANFGGLMQKQSRTLEGAASNIKDALGFGLAEAFHPLFDLIRSLAVDLADFLQTPAFTEFVQRVKSGIASLVQPIGTFLVMVGNIAKAHGLNLFQAALVALQITLGQVFGPQTAQSFNDLITTLQKLGEWAGAKLSGAFAWLGAQLPGWIEAGAVKLQEFATWLEQKGPAATDVVISKFKEWKQWFDDNIPLMVETALGAFKTLQDAATRMVAQLRLEIAQAVLAFAELPLPGAPLAGVATQLKPQIAALREQLGMPSVEALAARPPTPDTTRLGAAALQGLGGPIALTMHFGDIVASDPAQVQGVINQFVGALAGALGAAEPSPPSTLAGVLP